jgi:hypothetical protein
MAGPRLIISSLENDRVTPDDSQAQRDAEGIWGAKRIKAWLRGDAFVKTSRSQITKNSYAVFGI